MKLAIHIVQSIMLPKLEKDPSFDAYKTDIVFWESLATMLLDFEKDAKPIYAILYNLELNDPEKIISKLSNVYSTYLKELAECHVLGTSSKAIDYLLDSNNKTFKNEVQFFSNLEKAIKKSERKRIKETLPTAYEKLTFELSETDIELAVKKKGREALKEKMKVWDAEFVSEEVPVISISKKETKVISLSWLKYATAACVIVAAGIFYFKSLDNDIEQNQNSVVTTPDKNEAKERIQKPEMTHPVNEAIVLSDVEITSKSVTVLEPSSLGFTANDRKLNVVIHFKDATNRIISLEKILKTNKNKQPLDSKVLSEYEKELEQLNAENGKYLFDGKSLTLFEKNNKNYKVLRTEEQFYYLKKGEDYYALKITSTGFPLIKETNDTIIATLDKISFDNE